jgi:hypothetical protein
MIMRKVSNLEFLYVNGIFIQPHDYPVIRKMTHEEILELITRIKILKMIKDDKVI